MRYYIEKLLCFFGLHKWLILKVHLYTRYSENDEQCSRCKIKSVYRYGYYMRPARYYVNKEGKINEQNI